VSERFVSEAFQSALRSGESGFPAVVRGQLFQESGGSFVLLQLGESAGGFERSPERLGR
jgi:hypothetical protein